MGSKGTEGTGVPISNPTRPPLKYIEENKLECQVVGFDETGAQDNTVIAYGWTYTQLIQLSLLAARTHPRRPSAPRGDHQTWAWDGIVDHLLDADHPPSRTALMTAARKAIDAGCYGWLQAHGRPDRHGGQPSAAFIRYWVDPGSSRLEETVVEKLTVRSILRTLTPRQSDALKALVLCDYSPRRAAEYLGLRYGTYILRVGRARTKFLALWHQHETPSGYWRATLETADTPARTATRKTTIYTSLCRRWHGPECGCHFGRGD
jgi:hypothetical protein